MIRKAEAKDTEIIAENNVKMAEETENLILDKETAVSGVRRAIKDPAKAVYFLYEMEGEIVGQLMITKEWSDWRDGYFWWIQSVYVSKGYRRRGIFRELYSYIDELIKKDTDACGIRLYVEKNNISAQNTYQKMGMEKTHYLLYEMEKNE